MFKNSMVIWKIGIQKCHSHSDKVQTTKKKKIVTDNKITKLKPLNVISKKTTTNQNCMVKF